MRAPARELLPVAYVTLATGAELTWNAEDIISFSIQEGADSPLLPGNVISATCTLDLDNTSGRWLPGGASLGSGSLEAATVALALKVKDSGQWQSLSLGTYIITGISAPEQTPQMRLSCCDSIVTELAGSFTDDMTYPCTLSDLWYHALSQTRYVWQGTVPNGDAIIDAAPAWKDISLRQAMGYIAAAAGCFVRVNREGALDLVRCWTETPQSTLSEEEYLTWTPEFDAYGPVDALKVMPVKNAEGVQTPLTVYVDASGVSTGETVLVENNPLFQEDAAHLYGLAEGMLSQLAGLRLSSAKFNWRGDPAVGVGTRIRLTDTRGQAHDVTVTRQTLQFDAGFSATCSCETPGETNAGVLRAITPEGGVNADALVGTVDGGLLAVGSITSKSIHAASVTTDKLAANAVTAEKLAANSVTADKLTAESVTAEKLAAGAVEAQSVEAITAAINRITADDVSTNTLYAAYAHLIRLSAGSISAGTIETDQLAAALACFVTLTASTGEFDLATIKNLLSNALVLEEGLAGSMICLLYTSPSPRD